MVIDPYSNRTYRFASLTGLFKVVARVLIFVISPVSINTMIGYKVFPQGLRVWSSVGRCWSKGQQGTLVYFFYFLCYILRLFLLFLCLWRIVCFIVIPMGTYSHWFNPLGFWCYIMMLFVTFSLLWIIVCFIVIPRGTNDLRVNTLPILKHNCVKFYGGGGFYRQLFH